MFLQDMKSGVDSKVEGAQKAAKIADAENNLTASAIFRNHGVTKDC